MEEGYHSDQDIFADETAGAETESSPKTPTRQVNTEACRLKTMMCGIPPPPEVTNPRIDVSTIVSSWYSNKHLWLDVPSAPVSDTPKDYDIYLNYNSEGTEFLRLKIAERLVSSETSSSFVMHEVLTSSAKKRQRRNGWAKSPGSRLSYLAKRRNTFCKRTNDLSKARTISIVKDDKKNGKQCGKQPHLKRALFQSPESSNFSTPEPNSKRQRLISLNETTLGSSVHNNSTSKIRTCTRNLDSDFEKFRCEKLLNPRQKQLWNRTHLTSISTKLKIP